MSYKPKVRLVDPRGTSSTCPMCGGHVVKLRKGQVVKCSRCGLTLNKQLCGAINLYLKMRGFPGAEPLLQSDSKEDDPSVGGADEASGKGCCERRGGR